jgi:hypothetical protein
MAASSTTWPAILSEPREMERLVAKTPEIADLRRCFAVGRELGKKASRTSGRAHRYLYKGLQLSTEAYIRIASSDILKNEFLEICAESGIKQTAASNPLATLLKAMLGLDNKLASAYAMAIHDMLNRKISPQKIARYLGDCDGGLQGCVARARKARQQRGGKLDGAKAPVTGPRIILTTAALEALKANPHGKYPVLFGTMDDDGTLRITGVIRSRALHKLQGHLVRGPSLHRKAA